MPHDQRDKQIETTGALAGTGALSAEDGRAAAGSIAGEFGEFEDVASQLALGTRELQPPGRLRAALLSRIEAAQPRMHVMRTGEGKWKSPFPGVNVKTLYFDRETGMMTNLIRLEAGASYPPHRHSAMEQCLVLEGDVKLDEVVLGPGDYSRNDALSDHGRISSNDGCLLLIISSAKDELIASI